MIYRGPYDELYGPEIPDRQSNPAFMICRLLDIS